MLSRIYKSGSEKSTMRIAGELMRETRGRGVICLYGGLGTGKTVFSRGCAIAMGAKNRDIKSPTFSFIREYRRAKRVLYHCDFYRISNDDEILHHSLEEIFRRPQTLVIIEWADNLSSALPAARIDIFFEYTGRNSRRIAIIECVADTKWIYKLYKKYHTPEHVVKHMETVAQFAEKFALNLIKKDKAINLRRVKELSLLHDLLKHKSFNNRKINDVELTRKALRLLGKRDLSDSILTQQFDAVISKKYPLRSIEEKIVYYADKRVKHSKIVLLRERLRDGRARYWPDKNAPKIIDKIEKQIFRLEKQLAAAPKSS